MEHATNAASSTVLAAKVRSHIESAGLQASTNGNPSNEPLHLKDNDIVQYMYEEEVPRRAPESLFYAHEAPQ